MSNIVVVVDEVTRFVKIIDSGPQGPQGPAGPGVPVGGTTGQVLIKTSNTDYATEWATGGGGGSVSSVNVSGGTTGLTTSGGPITSSGTITLAGTLAVANGGTGATNAPGALTALGAYPASNPNGYTANVGTVTSVTAGTGLTGGTIMSNGTIAANFGTAPGTICQGNDARLATQTITLTGDVTGSGTGSFAATIANNAVTLAKMATMATNSILGRGTASTGNVEVLTALPFAYTGDVLRPADSNITTIANDVVTYAKIQNVSTASRLLGRGDSGTGDPQEITLGSGLSMSGTTLSASGAVLESDYTPSHSLLVQQSGTGSPSSLSVANNTLLGRLSGGGSNIASLTASQVRTLINVSDGANVGVVPNTAIVAGTKTKISYDAKGLVTAGADAVIADITGLQTALDAKQPLTPRVQTVASAATVTPTASNDLVVITAQAVGLTLANPTGTFVQGQSMVIRIKDNGTARSIAYGAGYRAIGVTLPTTTVINKTTYLGCIYNTTDAKLDIVGVCTEA